MAGSPLPETPDRAAEMQRLIELRDLASLAAGLDPGTCEGDAVGAAALAREVRRLVERAVELLGELQAIDDVTEVADMCFAGALELKRLLRELGAARGADDVVVTAESARRKLRRAVRAVLEVARIEGSPDILGGAHQGRHRVSDLESALAVRRLYATFRRGLRRPDGDSPEAVLTAVRYAAGAMALMVTEPDYADVRASDRAVLRALRARALDWARHDRSAREGLHLLEDLWTCADLLRGINRRQDLVAHDAALIAELHDGPGADLAAWSARLDALVGLDDRLDALLGQRAAAPLAALVPELLARLAELR